MPLGTGPRRPDGTYSTVNYPDTGVLDIEGCSSCPLVTDRAGVHTRRDVALSRGVAGLERDEMTEPIREVVCPITVDILVGSGPPPALESELCYHPDDPLAVTIRLGTADYGVCWTFARSLLLTGMFASTGEGDVVISPGVDDDGHALTYVELSSPDGVAILRTRSSQVAEFLRQTEQLVPIGQEGDHVDIDAVITYLLEESTA